MEGSIWPPVLRGQTHVDGRGGTRQAPGLLLRASRVCAPQLSLRAHTRESTSCEEHVQVMDAPWFLSPWGTEGAAGGRPGPWEGGLCWVLWAEHSALPGRLSDHWKQGLGVEGGVRAGHPRALHQPPTLVTGGPSQHCLNPRPLRPPAPCHVSELSRQVLQGCGEGAPRNPRPQAMGAGSA